jgi:hypothetical protein
MEAVISRMEGVLGKTSVIRIFHDGELVDTIPVDSVKIKDALNSEDEGHALILWYKPSETT